MSDFSDTSRPSIWHCLVFPLDAWIQDPDPDFLELKRSRLWPVLIVLLPLIVLAAGFGLDLGLFASLFFYAAEALLLAVLAKLYLRLEPGRLVELFFNFWFAFLLLTVSLSVLFFLIGLFLDA